MPDSRSIEVFKGIREAQQKLDYFLLGLSSALFAYVAGQYQPMPLSLSQNTTELAAILCLFVSIIAGFKRLDFNISIMKLNFQKLDMSERKGEYVKAFSMEGNILNTNTGNLLDRNEAAYTIEMISKRLPKVKANLKSYSMFSSIAFSIRNIFLILGFVALGASKLIGVYAATQGV